MTTKKIRVAIVVSHPIQHFVHLYKALAKDQSIELKVFFASNIGAKAYFDKDMNTEIKWNIDLLADYDYEFLPEAEFISKTGFWAINNPSIISALKKYSPDIVQLHGYAQLTMLRALVWCKWKRTPVLLSTDSSLLFRRAAWKMLLKDIVLTKLFSFFDGVIATGDNNIAYFKKYGVKLDLIFRAPFTVDQVLLSNARDEKTALRAEYREKYGIAHDEVVLLFVGKLAPWKRPQDLLDALSLAKAELGVAVKLVAFFAGDGAMRKELEAQAMLNNARAIFAGFINVDILPSIYAMSDVLVFPSEREPYGLSAREAICVGLPLIVSDQIGCMGPLDAARQDYNALVYPSLNADLLAKAIITLASNPQKLIEMSQASLRVADEMRQDFSLAGYINAVQNAYKIRK
jgi:glycosyltransferase involved in cell wall biosynthesis